jgi:hypothetical protein
LAESPSARAERPTFIRERTSAVLRRSDLGSMELGREACAAPAGAPLQGLAAAWGCLTLEEPVRAGALALFGLVCL